MLILKNSVTVHFHSPDCHVKVVCQGIIFLGSVVSVSNVIAMVEPTHVPMVMDNAWLVLEHKMVVSYSSDIQYLNCILGRVSPIVMDTVPYSHCMPTSCSIAVGLYWQFNKSKL